MVYLSPVRPAFNFPESGSESFSARIHTDPCCPNSRPQTRVSGPAVSMLACISGRKYLAKCSVQVMAEYSSAQVGNKSRRNVWRGQRLGENIAAEGDSGAPLYVRVGYGEAQIIGMHIGGNDDPQTPDDFTLFHSVLDIQQQLGVTVSLQ